MDIKQCVQYRHAVRTRSSPYTHGTKLSWYLYINLVRNKKQGQQRERAKEESQTKPGKYHAARPKHPQTEQSEYAKNSFLVFNQKIKLPEKGDLQKMAMMASWDKNGKSKHFTSISRPKEKRYKPFPPKRTRTLCEKKREPERQGRRSKAFHH